MSIALGGSLHFWRRVSRRATCPQLVHVRPKQPHVVIHLDERELLVFREPRMIPEAGEHVATLLVELFRQRLGFSTRRLGLHDEAEENSEHRGKEIALEAERQMAIVFLDAASH